MRVILAVVLLIGYPAVALGQPRSIGPTTPSLPPIGLPLPQIGLPLPPIGLPLAPIVLPSANVPPQPPPPIRNSAPHKPNRFPPTVGPTAIFFVPQYWWEAPQPSYTAPPQSTAPMQAAVGEIRTGIVRLAIEPLDAQLFVDGEFIGTMSDVNGELELEEGSHPLEIRAPGYESQRFRVRIVAGRAISYTGSLVRTPVSEPPPLPPPPTQDTFYLIPGCYMGNVPPEQVNLPATCDRSRVITSKR
jgi:hypothetical protein